MLWWIGTTALASAMQTAPMVVVDWAGDRGSVEVWAPLGMEVAPDAPASVTLAWADERVHWESTGEALERGVRVGAVRGSSLPTIPAS